MFRRLKRTRLKTPMRELVRETRLHKQDFIYPLFVIEGQNVKNEIPSMPDVFQLSVDNILKECEELLNLGIYHILLFGLPSHKDSCGSEALSDKSIIPQAIKAIKKHFPQMIITLDLCFCEYTDHGHCGILDKNLNSVDNDATLEILGQQALVLSTLLHAVLTDSSCVTSEL